MSHSIKVDRLEAADDWLRTAPETVCRVLVHTCSTESRRLCEAANSKRDEFDVPRAETRATGAIGLIARGFDDFARGLDLARPRSNALR